MTSHFVGAAAWPGHWGTLETVFVNRLASNDANSRSWHDAMWLGSERPTFGTTERPTFGTTERASTLQSRAYARDSVILAGSKWSARTGWRPLPERQKPG